ncbi:MAG: type I phosphomannose isomerase catalytic subunit [Planctomycetota bacterium]
MPDAYPLTFEPILKEKVWGGRRLSSLGKTLPTDDGRLVGESWEIADLASTDPGGGGGESARSVISNGVMAGQTLAAAIDAHGTDLLGDVSLTGDGGFPLLVKYLDAREHLSVQVHPSPAYAAAHADAHLKTECWYVVQAEPGSKLFVGIDADVSADDFRAHIEAGTVADVLIEVDAVPGEMHLLPSGTCHALGAGVLVAEVQTPSDTTYRVYDWTKEYARPERTLHIEQALACIDFGPGAASAPEPVRLGSSDREGRLTTTEYFAVDELRLMSATRPLGASSDGPVVLMAIDGSGVLQAGDGSFDDVRFSPGTTVLVPAACVAKAVLSGGPSTKLLRVTVSG